MMMDDGDGMDTVHFALFSVSRCLCSAAVNGSLTQSIGLLRVHVLT